MLRELIGKPLRAAYRATTMLCLHLGEFALHSEEPWRILGPEGLLTGKGDIYYTRDGDADDDVEGGEKTWASVGSTLFDARLEKLRPLMEEGRLLVEKVDAKRGGTLILDFSGGYRVEIVPTGTAHPEHWRLFRPGVDEPHVVMTPSGLDQDG